jgi:hypothetical protein
VPSGLSEVPRAGTPESLGRYSMANAERSAADSRKSDSPIPGRVDSSRGAALGATLSIPPSSIPPSGTPIVLNATGSAARAGAVDEPQNAQRNPDDWETAAALPSEPPSASSETGLRSDAPAKSSAPPIGSSARPSVPRPNGGFRQTLQTTSAYPAGGQPPNAHIGAEAHERVTNPGFPSVNALTASGAKPASLFALDDPDDERGPNTPQQSAQAHEFAAAEGIASLSTDSRAASQSRDFYLDPLAATAQFPAISLLNTPDLTHTPNSPMARRLAGPETLRDLTAVGNEEVSAAFAAGARTQVTVHVPRRLHAALPEHFDSFTKQVFDAVDGTRSMLAIASRVGGSPEEIERACHLLRSLATSGFIELTQRR